MSTELPTPKPPTRDAHTAARGALSSNSAPLRAWHSRFVPRFAATLGLGVLASTALAAADAGKPEDAEKPKEPRSLAKTVVSGIAEPDTAPSAATAAVTLADIPGAVSLVSSATFEKGRVGTAADILAFQPGVFAQSTGGQDALRVSIRGSGLNRGQGSFREGIHFLFDGLPLTGAGGSPYELFEPLGVSYTEILRGGNALTYGGAALGGAINYVTKTGHDASSLELRLELGSYGYHKGQIASGGVHGNSDYYVTVVGSERHGFQKLTDGYSTRAIANFGFKINERTTSRLYVRFGATGFENPGNLTWAQIATDPTQANPTNIALAATPGQKNFRLQQGSTWVGSKTVIKPDADTSIELGAAFHDYPIDIQAGTSRSLWEHDDLSLSGRYTNTRERFGHENTLTFGFQTNTAITGEVTTFTNNFATLRTQTRKYDWSGNYVAYLQNENRLQEKLWFSAAASLGYFHREARYPYLAGTAQRPEYDRDALRIAPRVGLRYEASDAWSFFANASRAVEPADTWKYNAVRNSATAVQVVEAWTDLKEQQADTVEIGTRVTTGAIEASLTWYHSWLKEELLTVVDPTNPTLRINTNATPTIHQGVEFGLNGTLWQEGGAKETTQGEKVSAHRVTFRTAYTFSDFHYRGDAAFQRNELPGLPRQFFQGELQYEHPRGFYVGASAQSASRYYVDYDNSYETPGYTIYNAKVGYSPARARWEVYVDFRNLTNERYATAVTPAYTTRAVVGTGPGRDTAVFQPGDGVSAFGGITWRF